MSSRKSSGGGVFIPCGSKPCGSKPRSLLLCSLLLCSAVLGGCKVTSEDVETWKGTVKGPGKLVAVLLADKYGIPLRSRAGLALIEMERGDVAGVQELQRAIQKLEPLERNSILDAMVPGLQKHLAARSSKSGEGPAPVEIRAKDASFFLITHATPASRQALTAAVIDWFTADFNGRSLAGNFSAEQVVRSLGSPAASMLVDALHAKLPSPALVKLTELVGQLGDPSAKQRAAQRLVAIEREMETDAYLDWLRGEIREQIKKGTAVDEKRVDRAARVNRENFIADGALLAMKHLATEPAVSNRLLEIASSAEASVARRTRALQALEGRAGPEHLDKLLALALGETNPTPVRDYAFDRVGDVRSKKAIPPMWSLVQNAQNPRLRWRAGELVLAIGGNEVVAEFLGKLPRGRDIGYLPEELEGYATRMGQMNPLPRGTLREQLSSPDWWNRVLALTFFERKGGQSDIALLRRLVGDTTPVKGKGWEQGHTVGKSAKNAIAALSKRLQAAATVVN